MTKEIERKFLVNGAFKKFATRSYKIAQGFLSTVPERTVRVRIKDNKGFITVKGVSNKSGTTRFEWEKEIELVDAENLLKLSETIVIKKTRYIVPTTNNLFFEVDEFFEENKGLLIAEIELPEEHSDFDKPDWLGKEVTGQVKYYNAMLAKKPYNIW